MIRKHFKRIDSTHKYALEHVEELEDQWLLYSADEQTAGRGQYSRKWVSPANVNIYATCVLPFPSDKQYLLANAAQVAALAIANALEVLGCRLMIKWPNDLLLNGKKIGGVLCENIRLLKKSAYSALIVSVGFNVNMSREDCGCIDQFATSLKIETGRPWDKEEILCKIQGEIYKNFEILKNDGFSAFLQTLNDRLAFVNKMVVMEQAGGKTIKGLLEGINEQGQIRLKTLNGHIRVLSSGRIHLGE